MKKNVKRFIVSGSLVLGLIIPGVASAYSGSYSFDISARIEGSDTHSLSNKSTSTTATADTYGSDGKSYTKNFGTVSSGTYTINVTKNDDTGYGSRVKGSGTIDQ